MGNFADMEPTLVRIGDAADRLGVTRRTVHRLLNLGEIEAVKMPGLRGPWIITEAALAKYEARRDGKGSDAVPARATLDRQLAEYRYGDRADELGGLLQ